MPYQNREKVRYWSRSRLGATLISMPLRVTGRESLRHRRMKNGSTEGRIPMTMDYIGESTVGYVIAITPACASDHGLEPVHQQE